MNLNFLEILIIVFLLLLGFLFVFYRRIIGLSILMVKIAFPASVLLILSTMFLPQVYTNFIESGFQSTPLAQSLKSVDKTLTDVSSVQISITNTINGIFNSGYKETVEQYKSNIYLQFVNLIALMLKLFILVIGFIILIFCIYVRYSFSGVFEVATLRKEVKKLKHQIDQINLKVGL
jgi:hypothetical protein